MAARSAEEWKAVLAQAEQQGDAETANKIRAALKMPLLDLKSGAPLSARSAVGASRGPGAQAQAAQNLGYQPFGQDNFISGNTIFNPPGMDVGDVASFTRPIAEAGGALVGGGIGLAAGGGPTMGLGAVPGMMAGSALGGHLAGKAMDLLAPDRVDTRTPGETLKDDATSALFNATGGPAAAAYRGPAALARVAPTITGAPASVEAAADEVYRRGGTTTPGQRGSRFMQRIEGTLESSPFAGPTMDRHRGMTMDIFGDIIDETTPRAGSRDVAGGAATKGFQYNKERAEAMVEDAYKNFDRVVENRGEDRLSRISARKLQELSDEYKLMQERDPGFGDMVFQDPDLSRAIASIDGLLENRARNLEDPTLGLPESPTYDVIKRLRTMIGKKIDFNSPGSEQMGLKTLYRTLTSDMESGAFELAGEEGQRAAATAAGMHHNLMNDLKSVDPVFKYAENPTEVYNALNRALINDPQLAQRAKEAMGPNQWDTFTDSWLRLNTRATKAGQDVTGDAASHHVAASSLAHLKKVSPEGYALMTQGKEAGVAVIDRLSNMLRDSDKYINRSRSGPTMANAMFGGDIVGAGVAGLAALASNAGPPSLPMMAGAAGLVMRPILSKLTAKAITSRLMNKALTKVGATYKDNLPMGEDLARALIAAGADRSEVQEIFGAKNPPLTEAGNANPY